MNAPWNAPISDRFSLLCARVFSPAAAILESEKTLGTRLDFQSTVNPKQAKCNSRLLMVLVYNLGRWWDDDTQKLTWKCLFLHIYFCNSSVILFVIISFLPIPILDPQFPILDPHRWLVTSSGRKNVMSMREFFCPDPLAGFENMAGFQIIYCLKIKCFHS